MWPDPKYVAGEYTPEVYEARFKIGGWREKSPRGYTPTPTENRARPKIGGQRAWIPRE